LRHAGPAVAASSPPDQSGESHGELRSRPKLMIGTRQPQYLNLHPGRLRKRSDFLSMRGARRYNCESFTLQARERTESATSGSPCRFGFTVTRKIGNAVQRNRIRRRLKQAVRIAADHAVCGHDYVIIARPAAIAQTFSTLTGDLALGLEKVSRSRTGTSVQGPSSQNKSRQAGKAPKAHAESRPNG
jgi:ribonuclease P protein component